MGPRISWAAGLPCSSFLDPYEFPALPSLPSSPNPCVVRSHHPYDFSGNFSLLFCFLITKMKESAMTRLNKPQTLPRAA